MPSFLIHKSSRELSGYVFIRRSTVFQIFNIFPRTTKPILINFWHKVSLVKEDSFNNVGPQQGGGIIEILLAFEFK